MILRLTPRYPAKSPLDDVLRLVVPGSDEFVTEKYAFEIGRLLNDWSQALKAGPPALQVLATFLDPSLQATPLGSIQESKVRSGGGIEVTRAALYSEPGERWRAIPGRNEEVSVGFRARGNRGV